MATTLTDDEVRARLKEYLARVSRNERTPVAVVEDPAGKINRAATLKLPCYWNMRAADKEGI